MGNAQNNPNQKEKTKVEAILSSLPGLLLREGYMLAGLRLQYQVSSWFCVINVRDGDGVRWVAYQGGNTVTHCLSDFLQKGHSGGIKWKKDRYQD